MIRRTIFLPFIALTLALSASASTSWYVSGEAVSGSRDYRETTLDAGLFYTRPVRKNNKKNKKKRQERPWVEGAWGFASRSEYGLRNSHQTTVTWMGGAGLDLAKGFGVDGSYWMTPAPRETLAGAYQGRGADGGFSTRWRGMLPLLRWPMRSSAAGLLYLSGGWAQQEQYFSIPEAPGWYSVHQTNAGAALSWTFLRSFTIGTDGRLYAYNRDLKAERLAFLPLANAGVAGPYDLLLGFPERSWGFKAAQTLWGWGDLTLRWRRTAYAVGVFPWSDTTSVSVGVYLWRGCGVRGRYEVNEPEGGRPSEYRGVAVELGF